MGAELNIEAQIPPVPWLDAETVGLLRATIAAVASAHPWLRAAILYGSVARREERALTDQHPSDVDLLLLFEHLLDQQTDFTYAQRLAIFDSMGPALDRFPHAPREVQVMLVTDDLRDWDETFITNVAREGLLLRPCCGTLVLTAVLFRNVPRQTGLRLVPLSRAWFGRGTSVA